MKTPEYLKRKDKIAIVAPAGRIDKEIIGSAKIKLENWGLEVVIGKNVSSDYFQYAGTDKERLQDFQMTLDDKNIKAIMCARGGYGLVRLIDQLAEIALYGNDQPYLSLRSFDPVTIPPCVSGVLHVIIKNEYVRLVDLIKKPQPRQVNLYQRFNLKPHQRHHLLKAKKNPKEFFKDSGALFEIYLIGYSEEKDSQTDFKPIN